MIIRPPSEADSYLLQITYGCSHNKCTFCGTYLDKPFRIRPPAEILSDIDLARQEIPETRRVFLCDGDAMVLPTSKLIKILESLGSAFPHLQRVGIYTNARDILKKTEADLSELAEHKLTLGYLGLESGHDEVLKRVKKGATAEEMIQAVRKAQACGIKMSVIGLLGLGGQEMSAQHAVATGRVVSRMNPRYFSLLTLMLIPGTPLYEEYKAGKFRLPTPVPNEATQVEPLRDPEVRPKEATPFGKEMVQEMRLMVEHIDSHHTIFRTNHASNYAPIGGTLNKDKDKILREIDKYLTDEYDLRPEFLRGL